MTSRLAAWSAELTGGRGRWLGITDLRAALGLRARPDDSRRDLVTALNEVADAVSRATDLEELLCVIVESAKSATGAEKVILALVDAHDASVDMETLVVRGARAQHLQDWWGDIFADSAPDVFAKREPVVWAFPEHDALMLRVPVRVRDHPIGLICAINSTNRPFSAVQTDFFVILSAFAATAIENTRIAEQERYLVLSSERNRIAREMHDGVVQSLFSVSLGLEVCKKLVLREPEQVMGRLDDLQGHLNTSMSELRRLVYDLRSMRLKQLGLERAIDFWIREVAENPAAPDGRLVVDGTLPALSQQLEMCLYRVAKESVSNVVKHARATHFEVRLHGAPDSIELVIEDDGDGFDVNYALEADTRSGFGLRSIRERVEREGGTLCIDSVINRGTRTVVAFSGLGEA